MQRSDVRRAGPLLVAFFLAAFTACGSDSTAPDDGGNGGGGGGGGTTPVATTSVSVTSSFSFSPEDIVVSPGATVTWTWSDSQRHNVTFASASITSSGDQSGGTFQSTMPTAPGTYNYSCTLHSGMDGSVQVQ